MIKNSNKLPLFLFACASFSALLFMARLGISQSFDSAALSASVYDVFRSPEEQLERRVMVGIPDTSLSAETADFIRTHRIKGILLLARNIESKQQLQKLTSDLHAIDSGIIIGVDQEGGDVSRILFPESILTPQSEIETETDAYIIARRRAEELSSYGIDMNFSPVADYITNPNSFLYSRTFHSEPEEIAMLAGAMLRGYQDGGVIPVLKHFPGHTDASLDTHENVARLNAKKEELERHMLPFKKIIQRFDPPAIMVGGSIYAELDSVPASLSKRIISDLLRDELRFRRMVITDDLEMGTFSEFALSERLRMAFDAGADMIIIAGNKTPLAEIGTLLDDLQDERQ